MKPIITFLLLVGTGLSFAYSQIPTENLSIWLKSTDDIFSDAIFCSTPTVDDSADAHCWEDQSINELTFRRIGSGTPTYRLHNQDTLNGFPGIYLDGTNGLVSEGSDSLDFTSSTIFVVASNEGPDFDAVSFAISSPSTWNNSFFLGSSRIMHHSSSGRWRALGHHVDWSATPYLITTGINGISPSDLTLYVNGLQSSASQFQDCCPGNYTNVERAAYVGQRGQTGSIARTGEIIEVIVYGGIKLGDAHRIMIENYLSSKYDLPIVPEGDFYGFDTEVTCHFDFMVTGIGVQNMDILRESESSELVIRELNGSLGEGEFLFIGQPELGDTNSISTTDLPVGVSERFTRVWAVEKTGDLDARCTFDYALGELDGVPSVNGQYSLLYSASCAPYDFSVVSTNAMVQGSQVQFDLTNAEIQNGYYTLGAATSILGDGTNISPLSLAELILHPNPAPGAFTLISPEAALQSIELYDLTGRRLPAEILPDRHEAAVRCRYRGIVLVQVQTEQGVWTKKVLME
ncbi:MAG: T9SS type A sorting domain-containing protein [Bacteroidota bacterium]